VNISFTVHGTPQPQGSTKAFIPKGWNRAIITSDNKRLKPWRQDVAEQAIAAMLATAEPVTREPIEVRVCFYFARPKSISKKTLYKITKPDVDKCLRSVFDSLTGVVFFDDSQVVTVVTAKRFGLPERAEIQVRTAKLQQVELRAAELQGELVL
jgi:crossover junction endodeoxyribonuclease RusA